MPEIQATPTPSPTSTPTVTATTEEVAMDLSSLGGEKFNPYPQDRNAMWILAPAFAIAIVLLHLRKTRRNPMKRTPTSIVLATAALSALIENAQAVEIEPMGKALVAALGTPKANKKVIGDTTVFFSKGSDGKADKVAFVQKNIYPPNCSHTWVVGLDKDGKVTEVHAQEMQCSHAFPAKAPSFLDQYKGMGPADVDSLKGKVNTIAKATGSCDLATDAVKASITKFQEIKGQL